MPYVTSIERLAREEGRQEGIEALRKGILELLKSKFPGAEAKYVRKVRAARDIERLQAILVAVGRAETLDEVRALLPYTRWVEEDWCFGSPEIHFEVEERMGREFIIRSMACDLGRKLGREEGLVEGLQKGIVALLRSKFQSEGAKLARKVRLKCEPKGWRASYGSRLGHKLSTRSGRGCASGGDGLPRRLLYRAHESFRYEMHRTEEERRIPYVTSIERLSKEEGREEDR